MSLKGEIGEDTNYLDVIKIIKQITPGQGEKLAVMNNVFCCPVYFAKREKEMLVLTKRLLEQYGGCIAIHPRFNKLLVSLRTATENGEGKLDKPATSHDDVFDAFRMSLSYWR